MQAEDNGTITAMWFKMRQVPGMKTGQRGTWSNGDTGSNAWGKSSRGSSLGESGKRRQIFYGMVVGNGVTIERVRLVSTTGHTLEDVPEQDLVLFLADESFDLPIEVELYGPGGNLVGQHRWPHGRISEQEGRFSHQVSSPKTSGFLMEDVKGLTNLELANALLTVAKQLQQWPREVVLEGNMRIDGQVQIETQRRSSTRLRFRIQPATG
jgi:hypothetical protein